MQDRTVKLAECWGMFHLAEALDALQFTLRQWQANEFSESSGEAGLAVYLDHAMDHLCQAWHDRHDRFENNPDVNASQEDFDAKRAALPNWDGQFVLHEIGNHHPITEQQTYRRFLNQATIGTYLRRAERALQDLQKQIELGTYDNSTDEQLGLAVAPIVCNICLTWHFRYLTEQEISAIDPATVQELAHWLVFWVTFDRHVVPLGYDFSAEFQK